MVRLTGIGGHIDQLCDMRVHQDVQVTAVLNRVEVGGRTGAAFTLADGGLHVA